MHHLYNDYFGGRLPGELQGHGAQQAGGPLPVCHLHPGQHCPLPRRQASPPPPREDAQGVRRRQQQRQAAGRQEDDGDRARAVPGGQLDSVLAAGVT